MNKHMKLANEIQSVFRCPVGSITTDMCREKALKLAEKKIHWSNAQKNIFPPRARVMVETSNVLFFQF